MKNLLLGNQGKFQRISRPMAGLYVSEEKQKLDIKEKRQLFQLISEVKNQCTLCLAKTDKNNPKTLFNARADLEPSALYEALEDLMHLLKDQEFTDEINALYENVDRFDFELIRANGVRSMIGLLKKCLAHLLSNIRDKQVSSFKNFSGSGESNIISYTDVMYELKFSLKIFLRVLPELESNLKFKKEYLSSLPLTGTCDPIDPLNPLSALHDIVKPSSLDQAKQLENFNDLMLALDLIRQEHFYGRCMAFYMVPHAKKFFEAISSVLAGFADSFEKRKEGLFGAFNTMIHSMMSFWSPEERGLKIAQSSQRADVNLAKNFWGIAEHKIFSDLSHAVLPSLEVIDHITLPNVPIRVQVKESNSQIKYIEYQYPEEVNICILSNTQNIDQSLLTRPIRNQSNSSGTDKEMKKTCLVLHIHGGGFVSMSSKGHEVYLRDWVKKWDCPVISVNYSLSPERVYPLALQQCFYTYCWMLKNREKLGCTSDARIVVCGDSAGGNLSAGVCLMVAAANLSVQPLGLGLIYTPLLLAFVSTPSKFMAYCDPLLPAGILARCLLAYNGIDETASLKEFFDKSPVEIASEVNEKLNCSTTDDLPLQQLGLPVSNPRARSQSLSDLSSASITSSVHHSKTNETFLSNISQRRRPRVLDPKNPLPYLRRFPLKTDAYNSPILASDKLISKLPPTTVMLTQTDVFLDEGIEFSRRLRQNHVPVKMVAFEDLPHGFLNFAPFGSHMQKATHECRDLIHDLLKQDLRDHHFSEEKVTNVSLQYAMFGTAEVKLINYVNALNELMIPMTIMKNTLPKLTSSLYFEEHLMNLPKIGSCDPKIPMDPFSADSIITRDENQKKEFSDYVSEIDKIDSLNQEYFYGDCLAFYMVPQAKRIFEAVDSVLGGFANSHEEGKSGLLGYCNAACKSIDFYCSTRDRGKQIALTTQYADIDFCKKFWGLGDNRYLLEMNKIILPRLTIVKHMILPNQPISVDIRVGDSITSIDFAYPEEVNVCLLSKNRLNNPDITEKVWKANEKPNDCIVMHIHGGGFVSMSSKGHEVYLRNWTKTWSCPVVSVNYALAPERSYPTALLQCFYTYCWILRNRGRLGCTQDARIVVCGDSAGGNLSAGVCTMAANMDLVEKPSGLCIMYAPLVLGFVTTPSKLMAYCDPLLPAGILCRCLFSYNGIDESILGIKPREEKTDSNQPIDIQNVQNENFISKRRQPREDNVDNPLRKFRNYELKQDSYKSPLLASDHLLKMLPPTTIICSQADIFLDDGIEYAKRLLKNNVPVKFEAVADLPHGFVNLGKFGEPLSRATDLCRDLIQKLIIGDYSDHDKNLA